MIIDDSMSAISIKEPQTITLGSAEGKSVFTRSEMRILTRTGVPENVIKQIEDFVNIIENTGWLQTDPKPNKEWDVSPGNDWNEARHDAHTKVRVERLCSRQSTRWHVSLRQNAKLDAAYNIIRSMARTAGRYDALAVVRDGVERAVKNTIRGAMRGDAWDLSRDTKFHTEQCAVQDAVLRACFILTSDLPFDDKKKRDRYIEFAQHAEERWEVWPKGWALLCALTQIENDSLNKEKEGLGNRIKQSEKLYVYGVKIFKEKQQTGDLNGGYNPEFRSVAR